MLKLCATGLAIALPLAVLAGPAAADPVETRQNIMKSVGAATGTLGKMIKGEIPYDATAAGLAMRVLFVAPTGFVHQFPDGSQAGGKTEASPKIWEDRAGFEKIAVELEMAALAAIPAASGGLDQLKGAFGSVARNCKSCHEGYRIQKN